MPGLELVTVFSISLRFIEINALQKSICKIPEEMDEVSIYSYENLVKCIMVSAPAFNPTPHCKFSKSSFASNFASLAKRLAISRLKTSPTAIGRIPHFIFSKADSYALQRVCETNSGRSPRQLMFTSLVKTLKAICDYLKRYTVQHAKDVRQTFLMDQLL